LNPSRAPRSWLRPISATITLGRFWILAEFKQFHNFQGLPFDTMCDNITADAGEGTDGGHGHESR